ncbi:hypothetical protein M3Y97_00157300 [Aphelenchoides bicaudatus]|nr:hypothetical protein M3Y97_00157300 [Aphelenchoides bicaudatus]
MSSSRHLLDVRWRKAIVESLYVNHLHSTARFLLALPEDATVLLNYIEDNVRDPLGVATDISPQNQRLWYEKQMNEWLKQDFTIIVTDCFEVYGLAAARLLKNSKTHSSLDIESDYGEKVAEANAPSDEGKFMKAFIDELHSKTSNFLPEDCSDYLQIEMFQIHPEYQGAGIGHRLLKELLKLAKNSSIKYVSIACTSDSMTKLAKKLKFESKFSIPYAKFTCNKEPVFGEAMHDGTLASHLMICNLSQLELKDGQPTLPNAYQLPKTERRLLDEVRVQLLDLPLRYEIAVPEDEPVIRDFMINEYYRQTNIPRTLQCQKEDFKEMENRFNPECIYDELVILAIYDGRLCAISVNYGYTLQKENLKSGSSNEICIPDDFTPLIDKQVANHLGVRSFRGVNGWLDAFIPELIPDDCDRYFVLNNLSVNPDFRGCGIAKKLWIEAMKLADQKSYRYVQCLCSAIGSSRIAEKSGLQMVFSLPCSKIMYKGEQLFPNGQLNDGADSFNMSIGDLREILH